jgi:hypothetical protein
MSVKDLEQAVSELEPGELAEFAAWFEGFVADRWDRQIAGDAADGRLDHHIKEADEDFEAGRCTDL